MSSHPPSLRRVAAATLAATYVAAKGDRSTTLAEFVPGTYLLICTIPVGGDEDATENHADRGMVTTLTVT